MKLRTAVAGGAGLALAAALAAGAMRLVRSVESVPPASAVPSASAQVSGRVQWAPDLRAGVQADDTVLIYARVLDGPRQPVALLKRKASELPLDFVLDERAATNPTLRLSPSTRLVVGARVVRLGANEPQPEDPQGVLPPVAVGTGGLLIEIGRKLP